MNKTSIQGNIKQIGNYILEVELGKGQFGKVFKAREKTTGTFYAVKRIDKSKIQSNPLLPKLLNTEIKVMQEIEHPNILHLFDFIESQTHYYLILNFCNQGDMEHYMKTRGLKYFEEEEALGLLKQILNGFHVLRQKKVLHRDFKLANIFMNDGLLVIGDFGLAKQGADTGSTMLGTPQTMAPELLFQNVEETLVYDSKADIWSIGVVYYQLLFGDTPYSGIDYPQLRRSMKERTGNGLIFLRNISDESKDVLRRMLTIDVNARINWAELFNHKVFNKKTTFNPSVVPAIESMMKSFASGKNRPVLDPQAQFMENREHAQSVDRLQFLPPDQMKPVAPPLTKYAEEKPIDPNLENQILQEMALKEITYTYNHERNKILFLVFSVKHIQWALTKPKFALYAEPFFLISLLILKKAKVLNDGLIQNLTDGNNIFLINDDFWRLYRASPHLPETKMLFVSLSNLLQEYFEVVHFRTTDNGFSPKAHDRFLSQPNPDLVSMDKVTQDELKKILAIKSSDSETITNPSHASKLQCLEKLIDTCINSEVRLKYIEIIDNVQKKFNMELYYKKLTENQGVPFY